MTKISANGNKYFLLLMVFIGASSMVVAVDIHFYEDAHSCRGFGGVCKNAPANHCCRAPNNHGSVQFTNMNPKHYNQVFANWACNGNSIGQGSGNKCYVGGGYYSGRWGPKGRPFIADIESEMTNCEGEAKITSIVFTEVGTGSWMLDHPDADDLFSAHESLPDGEKLSWLKNNGAVFYSSTADMKIEI